MRAIVVPAAVAVVLAFSSTCRGMALPSSDWDRVNEWLGRSGLTSQQQDSVRNQLQQIEKRAKQQQDKQRKEDVKKSLDSIKEAYEKGKKAYQEQRYSAAYLHFLDVASSSLKEAAKMAGDAKSKVLEIEAMALTKLEQAQICLLQNQPLQAAEILQQVIEGYPYCEAAVQARGRLAGLRSTPSVAASIRYGEGKAQEEAEAYAKALVVYEEVAQRWPGELAALRAKVAADGIRGSKEKMEMVREALRIEADRNCPTLLNLARNFIFNMEQQTASRRPDDRVVQELRLQAEEKLNQIIRDYPETPYAEEARGL